MIPLGADMYDQLGSFALQQTFIRDHTNCSIDHVARRSPIQDATPRPRAIPVGLFSAVTE